MFAKKALMKDASCDLFYVGLATRLNDPCSRIRPMLPHHTGGPVEHQSEQLAALWNAKPRVSSLTTSIPKGIRAL